MTKRFKQLSILIALSLIGLLGLQAYFVYSDYQANKKEFSADVNVALEVATNQANEHRKKQIGDLYKRDLKDTNIVRLEYDLDSPEGIKLELIDVATNSKEVSITMGREEVPDSLIKQYVFDRLTKWTYADDDHGYIVLSSVIGDRLYSYMDTLSVDMDLFRSSLNEELLSRSVSSKYEMVIAHKDSSYLLSEQMEIVSGRFKLDHKGRNQEVLIYFEGPFFDILKRSSSILMTCFGVMLITAVSFYLLIQTIREQKRLSGLKDDFIDGMTHELLTPISTMKIALESMGKPEIAENSEKSQKYLHVSKLELDRINDIVQNVLYSSLHNSQNINLKFEKLNLNELMENLINYHKARTERELEIELIKLEEPLITSDKQHITNVIHNLLDNAIKYADSEPVKISIVAKRFDKEVSIVVNDNGRGIPYEDQEKIFGKFYRVPDQRQNVKGLGIGLYYVKSILIKLNGDIELLSSSNKGSSFRISLSTTTENE